MAAPLTREEIEKRDDELAALLGQRGWTSEVERTLAKRWNVTRRATRAYHQRFMDRMRARTRDETVAAELEHCALTVYGKAMEKGQLQHALKALELRANLRGVTRKNSLDVTVTSGQGLEKLGPEQWLAIAEGRATVDEQGRYQVVGAP